MRTVRRGLALAAAAAMALGPLGAAPVAAADVATDDHYSGFEDQVLNVPAATGVLSNDVNDGGAALCVLSFTTGTGFAIAADGSFTFTPAPDAAGQQSTSYDLGSVGAGGACTGPAADSAQVVVDVQNVNDPPVVTLEPSCSSGVTAAEDAGAITKFNCVNVSSFGANDVGQGLQAWVVTTANPAMFSSGPAVTVEDPWALTFTTAPNANGSTTISVKARDTGGTANGGVNLSDAVVISLTITPVNDAPSATSESFTALKGRTLNVAGPGVLGNDSDVDGDSLTAEKVTDPVHGVLTLAANGGFSYTPAAGYTGPDVFSYKASDGSLASQTRVVNLAVTDVPATPTPAPTATPTATPSSTPEPTVDATPIPAESLAPQPSVTFDAGSSAAPTVALTAPPSATPRATAEPDPAGDDDDGFSLPVLLVIVLLVVLLAFAGAALLPKWMESRR